MYSGTKKLILDYLMDETAYLKRKNRHHYSSAYIADKFVISRSLSSHYLNDLYKEGELIKVNERPVLYLHKDILAAFAENHCEVNMIPLKIWKSCCIWVFQNLQM